VEAFVKNWFAFEGIFKLVSSIKLDVDSPEEFYKMMSAEARVILEALSTEPKENNYEHFYFYLKPILKIKDEATNENFYVIPFPVLLNSTIQFTIESYIQKSDRLAKLEEKSKGKIVEFITRDDFSLLPNNNIIKNFKYKIDDENFESDGLIVLKDSIWAIEIKSHPIFNKIPENLDKIVPIFVEKVTDAMKQGKRTIDYLSDKKDLLFSINCEKDYSELTKGVIIVLDGFLPTLLTQNKDFDEMIGLKEIYKKYQNLNVYVINTLDLFIISAQPDKENFEKFLKWRTSHFGDFPVIAFDEREYWAFFNDVMKSQITSEMFEILIERKNKVTYTSARFNRKDYLDKILVKK
jgi:hypothetical protein